MFSKNNIKNIIVLALGFFICSSIYLTESTILTKYSGVSFSHKISILYGNLAMALGILIFSIIYRKTKNIKKYYIISTFISLTCLILFFLIPNKISMSIFLCLYCMFGTSGLALGYHFSMLATIDTQYQARVFSIGYALGSLFSFIITLMPINIYASSISLIVYVPLIILNLYLVVKNETIDIIEKEKYKSDIKKHFITISIIVILMAFLSTFSTDVISSTSFDMKGVYTYSRVCYALGLIVAGILCDKKREIFDILTLSSFIFYLVSIVLLNQNISPGMIVALSYFFSGFFVVFRTIIFINLSTKKRSLIFVCAYGLMYSRVIEGLAEILKNDILNAFLISILFHAIMLCILILIYVLMYVKTKSMTENEKIKDISIKYQLSIQEEKVLNLLMQDLTNQEIADKLFLSINTIKNHLARIYKKTGMTKKELRERIYF